MDNSSSVIKIKPVFAYLTNANQLPTGIKYQVSRIKTGTDERTIATEETVSGLPSCVCKQYIWKAGLLFF